MINQIIGITLFVIWTAIVYRWSIRRVKELLDILHKQEERYDDCVNKLKLRSEQNDTLMQVIDELNKKLQEAKK